LADENEESACVVLYTSFTPSPQVCDCPSQVSDLHQSVESGVKLHNLHPVGLLHILLRVTDLTGINVDHYIRLDNATNNSTTMIKINIHI